MTGIPPRDIPRLLQDGALLLDVRDEKSYVNGHIKGAANVKIESMQVVAAKTPQNRKIVLIDGDGSMASQIADAMTRFGFDARFLDGGMSKWPGNTAKSAGAPTISGDELAKFIESKDVFLLDVREENEFADFKIPGAVNIPLGRLFVEKIAVPENKKVVTICSHGNRSMVATLALAQAGIEATSLTGGMAGWNQVLAETLLSKEQDLSIIQVEKIGKGCLSYVIESGSEAAVVDPAYPAERYMEIAKAWGFKIRAVLDTHQHADHVSAAAELATIADAKLYFSVKEDYRMNATMVDEGAEIALGSKKIAVLHTPGHTPGSMTYIVDRRFAMCGDTIFADSVGRPDLRDKAVEFAGQLYHTLHEKILSMPQDTIILPAHHEAGSRETRQTTVRDAKNLPLLDMDKAEFVSKIARATMPRPMNYSMIIKINRGSIPVPVHQIPDLEMGPNRCSVRM